MVCFNRPYYFKFFKGCPPQVFLDPFLIAFFQISSIPKDFLRFFFFLGKDALDMNITLGVKGLPKRISRHDLIKGRGNRNKV